MVFNFRFKLYKKKRGNFRPKIEIKLDIKANDYHHRPKLWCINFIVNSRNNSLPPNAKVGELYRDANWAGRDGLILPDSIYYGDYEKRDSGNMNSTCNNYTVGDTESLSYSYRYKEFFSGGNSNYLDEDIHIEDTCYLEWRPGSKPNYDDYIEAFKKLPAIFEEMLREGEDSGENDEYEFDNKSLKNEQLENENKTRKGTRKIQM